MARARKALPLAKAALVRALRQAGSGSLIEPGYARTFRENVIPAVSDQTLSAIERQLRCGDGNELTTDKLGRMKGAAAYSSSALAVSSFGWCARPTDELLLLGASWPGAPAFETKFPSGLPGRVPNLDVVVRHDRRVVAIESKCLEILSSKVQKLSESYREPLRRLASPSWLDRVDALIGRRSCLDAAQLVRHYVGLKHSLANDANIERITLLYIFWEPDDASRFVEYSQHRAELDAFQDGLEDPRVMFEALSYPALWNSWRGSTSPTVRTALSQLDARYALALAQ